MRTVQLFKMNKKEWESKTTRKGPQSTQHRGRQNNNDVCICIR